MQCELQNKSMQTKGFAETFLHCVVPESHKVFPPQKRTAGEIIPQATYL